ncbi:hypothetical protein AAG570_000690 [Ranatra chinensis]|uniref:Cathepsin L1-like n=1 Tax=Ranatra chinensis TaxID=642074 RepID=A0ABD0YXS7_9HEMI
MSLPGFLLVYCLSGGLVSGCLTPVRSADLDPHWNEYKSNFQKAYNRLVESARRSKWEENFERIRRHNEEAAGGKHNYTLKVNHLADMSRGEYLVRMTTLRHSRRRRLSGDDVVGAQALAATGKLPEEVDWRAKGFVTPSWNQRDCGACYAFSVVSSVEGQLWKKTGGLVRMSEQQVVDCSIETGNMGCDGGSLRNTLKYLEQKGLMTSLDYPYLAKQGLCRYSKHKVAVNITKWAILPARDEETMKAAVATLGPIPVSINASPRTFQFYHKGVYDDPKCPDDAVNHAMLLVGYTKHAWILKNWWTDTWGDHGYMYIRRGKNRCGISNYAAYVVIV